MDSSIIEEMKAKKDISNLIIALKNMYVQWYAAEALGEIGDVRALEPLIQALRNSDSFERYEYRERALVPALVKLGEAAIGPLIQTLKEKGTFFPGNAARALVEIGKPAVEPLIQALKDKDSTSKSRKLAIFALQEIGDARAVEPLNEAMKDEDNESVRKIAQDALENIKA